MAAENVTPAVVADFLNRKMPRDWYPIKPKQVGDYRWLDVNHDKNLEFFITYSDSRFFNTLIIFGSCGGTQTFLLQEVTVWELEKLDMALKDLDQDGVYELIVPKMLGFYRGAAVAPIWTAVYRWHSGKFLRADSEFPEFYKTLLPITQNEIQKLNDEGDKRWEGIDTTKLNESDFLATRLQQQQFLAVHEIVRDKILRLIGERANAGYKEAMEWAKSPDATMRENAIIVFGDIFDNNSRRQLELLSKDPDKMVANQANYALHKPRSSDWQ